MEDAAGSGGIEETGEEGEENASLLSCILSMRINKPNLHVYACWLIRRKEII
jgi:hypothetical protein